MPSAFTVPSFGPAWIVAIIIIGGISIIIELLRGWKSDVNNFEETIEEKVLLKIMIPKSDADTAKSMEQLLVSLHSLIGGKDLSYVHISLEITSSLSGIQFLLVCPNPQRRFIEGLIYAYYPDAEVYEVAEYMNGVTASDSVPGVVVAEGELQKDSLFPIKDLHEFQYDPLSAVIASMSTVEQNEIFAIQILLRAVSDSRRKKGKEYIAKVRRGVNPNGWLSFFESTFEICMRLYDGIFSLKKLKVKEKPLIGQSEEKQLQMIERKTSSSLFAFSIRIVASSATEKRALENIESCITALQQFDVFELNRLSFKIFSASQKENLSLKITHYKERFLDFETFDILAANEIAAIYHLPSGKIHAPQFQWLRAKKVQPPQALPMDNCIYIGKTNYRGESMRFGIKKEDRRKHTYMLGKTGSGKTSLMKQMIIQDIRNGEGVGVIDPHGELIEDLLCYIPPERKDDVIYLDPADTEFPVALNIFSHSLQRQRDYIASSILDVFKKHFDSWGPRLEYILHNVIITLLQSENANLLGIQRILTDPHYRRYILNQINDPILLKFWNEEYAFMERNTRLITETIAPIQNKVGRFLSSSIVRNIIGQSRSSIDFRDVMDTQKIFLCNLSQGKLGEESSALLGSLIITKMQSSAMERVAVLESDRKDFYLYIDEFQNFSTLSFVKILSEARKYRLNLILANQYLYQLREDIQQAIFGNIGTLINFIVGAQDAHFLEKEYAPIFSATDLMNLERYQMYVRETIDGVPTPPFSADSLSEKFEQYLLNEEIIASSRRRYANERSVVEDEIRVWAMKSYNIYDSYKKAQYKNSPLDLADTTA